MNHFIGCVIFSFLFSYESNGCEVEMNEKTGKEPPQNCPGGGKEIQVVVHKSKATKKLKKREMVGVICVKQTCIIL